MLKFDKKMMDTSFKDIWIDQTKNKTERSGFYGLVLALIFNFRSMLLIEGLTCFKSELPNNWPLLEYSCKMEQNANPQKLF